MVGNNMLVVLVLVIQLVSGLCEPIMEDADSRKGPHCCWVIMMVVALKEGQEWGLVLT